VFASLEALGGTPPHTVVVGCEVESVEESMGLSAVVGQAVDEAVDAVADVVASLQVRAGTGHG
jgi:hydrogenase maturation protease